METATVQATLSNRGGRIVRWRLKDYRDDRGEPVDLVPSALPADQPTPFSLRVDDEATTNRLNSSLYRVSGATNDRVDVGGGGATVSFEFEDASGLRARKEFRFDPGELHRHVLGDGDADGGRALNPAVVWGPGLGDIGAHVERWKLLHRQLHPAAAGHISSATATSSGTAAGRRDRRAARP